MLLIFLKNWRIFVKLGWFNFNFESIEEVIFSFFKDSLVFCCWKNFKFLKKKKKIEFGWVKVN